MIEVNRAEKERKEKKEKKKTIKMRST